MFDGGGSQSSAGNPGGAKGNLRDSTLLEYMSSSSPPRISFKAQEPPEESESSESETLLEQVPAAAQNANPDSFPLEVDQETELMAKALVRLALAAESRRQLLRRDDIKKKILKDRSKIFQSVFQKAQEILRNIFGMELVQTTIRERKANTQVSRQISSTLTLGPSKPKSKKSYILRSLLPAEFRAVVINQKSKRFYTVIICIILCIIRVSGGVILEEQLLKHLEEVGIHIDQTHEEFGPLEELLPLFVRQAYLDRTKFLVNNSLKETHRYKWGPRAKVEFPDEKVISFMAGVYNFSGQVDQAQLQGELRNALSISTEVAEEVK